MFVFLNVFHPFIQTVCSEFFSKNLEFFHNSRTIIAITVLNHSYIVHCGTEIVGVGQGGPGHVVQQVDFLGASTGLMVSDLICWSIGIDQFNGLSL